MSQLKPAAKVTNDIRHSYVLNCIKRVASKIQREYILNYIKKGGIKNTKRVDIPIKNRCIDIFSVLKDPNRIHVLSKRNALEYLYSHN